MSGNVGRNHSSFEKVDSFPIEEKETPLRSPLDNQSEYRDIRQSNVMSPNTSNFMTSRMFSPQEAHTDAMNSHRFSESDAFFTMRDMGLNFQTIKNEKIR